LLTQNQTPAQPRVKWKVRGSAAGSFTSGSSTPTPAVSVAVTGTSAKPAKSAENETSTRSKVRTSRTSAAR
jgi:flavin reductase (DIM6/NTAB) family NADH-FMN oxidoreductase RutF